MENWLSLPRKRVVTCRLTERLDMTIAIDWGVILQSKQTKYSSNLLSVLFIGSPFFFYIFIGTMWVFILNLILNYTSI